jgi:pyruvate dehydrogenase (quinone)
MHDRLGISCRGLSDRRLDRRTTRPEDLRSALQEAFSHDGPALVDVVSARQELVMPPVTTVGEAANFSLFMTRSVLDGRLAELIDLAKVNLLR